MVNFAVALTSASVIGGVVIFMALWAYEEYQKNQRRQRYGASSSRDNSSYESDSARAPPQPTNDCIICHDRLSAPLEVLPCGHLFHRNCIRKWFERRMLCPMCRASIPSQMQTIYRRRLDL